MERQTSSLPSSLACLATPIFPIILINIQGTRLQQEKPRIEQELQPTSKLSYTEPIQIQTNSPKNSLNIAINSNTELLQHHFNHKTLQHHFFHHKLLQLPFKFPKIHLKRNNMLLFQQQLSPNLKLLQLLPTIPKLPQLLSMLLQLSPS